MAFDQCGCHEGGDGGTEDGSYVVADAGAGVAHVGGEEFGEDGGHGAEDEAHDKHAGGEEDQDSCFVGVTYVQKRGEAEAKNNYGAGDYGEGFLAALDVCDATRYGDADDEGEDGD